MFFLCLSSASADPVRRANHALKLQESQEKRAPLELKGGASASALVDGLSSTLVSSVDDGLALFENANQLRVVS